MAAVQDNVPGMPAMSTMVFDGGPGSASRSVKRPRPVKSCTTCRSKKLKCDREKPCSQCQKSNRVCKYASEMDSEGGNVSDGSENEVLPDRPTKRSCPPSTHDGPPTIRNGEPPAAQPPASIDDFASRLDRLEKTVYARSPASVPDVALPRHHHRRPTAYPHTVRVLTVKDMRTRFFGQTSSQVLLNLFDEAKDFMNNKTRDEGIIDLFIALHKIYRTIQQEHEKALTPITVFVDSLMPVQKRMVDILPKKPVCDRLLDAYFSTSETLYRIVHIPSFLREYERYWEGNPSPDSFLPRLLAMLSIGSRFDSRSRGLAHERLDGVHVATACALVRAYLDALRGKQRADYYTLQTEVLLVHGQRMISPKFQDAWVQLGFIVRMAMSMGLHRDPSEFPELSPFCGELRRRLWYSVADMDLHVSLSCGLPCLVREGEYTCRPPRNLDDDDIYFEMKELPDSRPLDQFTSAQLQVYAANCLPQRMKVASIISRLECLKDYQEVLELGAKLELILDDINSLFPRNHNLDVHNKSREWRTRALLDMLVRRPLVALYRPFALGAPDCPPQISFGYLKSVVTILTYMDELDPRSPDFIDVSHMYHLVLKPDIIQAAFSVCHYIKNPLVTPVAPPPTSQWVAANSPESVEESQGLLHEGRLMWSSSRLTRMVEKSLESLIGRLKDSSSGLKDIVALAVVLGSVQPGPPEQRLESMKTGLRTVLEASLNAANTSAEAISAMPVSTLSLENQQVTFPYMPPRASFSSVDMSKNGVQMPDDYSSFWDIDLWEVML